MKIGGAGEGADDEGLALAVSRIDHGRPAALELGQDPARLVQEFEALLEEERIELVPRLEQRNGFVAGRDFDDGGLGDGDENVLAAAEDLMEPGARDDRTGESLLVDPSATGLADQRPAVPDVIDELPDVGLGHHHRIRGDDQLVLGRPGSAEVVHVEKINGDVLLEKGLVDALERFAEIVDAHRLALAGERLLAADHVGKRVVEDGDLRLRRKGPQEEVLVLGDRPGDPARLDGPLRDLAVELDQAVAAGLVARAHRIVGVYVDRPGPVGNGRPHPIAEVRADHRIAHLHAEDAVTRLELADIEPPCCRSPWTGRSPAPRPGRRATRA